MTKAYETYQRLEGEPETERDKQEMGSDFWNEGKWNNYVKPFLTEDTKEKVLIDMGCNAGLYLKLAEDMGFRSIGVDSNKGAVERGRAWRDKQGGKYEIINANMREVECIDNLPIADFTLFINSSYYMTVNEFLDYLNKLQLKTRYCIIVTAEKRHMNRCWASADVTDIRNYFKTWEETGFIDELPLKGSNPRRLWGLCFKSPYVEREDIDKLDSSNHVQDQFYTELDKGVPYKETRYYRILKPYRKNWSEDKLNKWIEERIRVYEDLKNNGQKIPIIVDKDNRILDGNHRYSMMKSLNFKSIFTRKV